MNGTRFLRTGATVATLAAGLCAPSPAPAQQTDTGGVGEYRGAAALGLALRRIGTTKRVLMVGAHPDDEYTPLLAHLALVEGAEVAYLSLTRGEGGQNGIGPELGEGLGLLRSEELLAARRVDGARQFFTRAYDFGFSKSADEAFRQWPREELLRDAVWVIRRFRPDVVVTVFSGTPRDGHGQHQASAIIGREAFFAASNSARFPEQLAEGVATWRPAKLYQSLWGGAEGSTLRLEVGGLDPLTGRSPYQLAMASRSRHRSQDMGRPESAGPRWAYLRRVFPEGGAGEASLWEGVDTTLSFPRLAPDRLPRRLHPLERAAGAYAGAVEKVRQTANPLRPDTMVPALADLVRILAPTALPREVIEGPDPHAAHRASELEAAQRALALASGLVLDATADDARIVPGQSFILELSLWNGGARPVTVDTLFPVLPAGWMAEALDTAPAPRALATGTLAARRWRVRVPADVAPTEPYFLRAPRQGSMYRWPDGPGAEEVRGEPFEPGPVWARAVVTVARARLRLDAEATFREVDPRQGELRRPVLVVPAVSVRLEPVVSILPTGGASPPLRYRVRLSAERETEGTLRVEAPAGWRAEPASLPVRFPTADATRDMEVTIHAPAGAAEGAHPVSARFQAADGAVYARGVQLIDYPHVRARPLYHAASSTVRAFEVRVPAGLRVAYIEGAGEEGPGVLAQLGITPDLLDARALAEADLDRYDVIVAGSRAYEVRPDLAAGNARLLEYVRRGGTLVVQYNKYELVEGGFTPYPLTMGRPHDRVSDEASPVRILEPAHPVLTTPNRITERDFARWIQERGLYFARTWDPRYTPLLEMADPGERPLRGGLLVAPYGEGTYVYTGLAFFRQLPEGVPGAWRLFANLLALGARR
ncbi:MAG TPA: PIG-L family deacetylase [Longimicrobiaceae bacterium]|nr:PIG-L family deacetylase [Longimicrobiaceae bacterium]